MLLCAPREQMADLIVNGFHEAKVGQGLSIDGRALEIFAGPNKSFTVTKTDPGGTACIVEMGVGWQFDAAGKLSASRP